MMMIPPNAPQLVKALHECYTARTGFDIAYNIARENTWREWCSFGGWKWTSDDLTRVIHYLRQKINKGERNDGALKFQNLIGRPDNFEEDLQLARKEHQGLPTQRRRSAPQHQPAETEEAPQDAAEAARRWKEEFGK